MVKDVENGLVANSPLQFKFPDIASEEVYAIKYSNIGHILEKIEELQLVPYKLPLSLRFSDEFEATFRNVSSIRGGGTIYSTVSCLGLSYCAYSTENSNAANPTFEYPTQSFCFTVV